MIWNTLCTKRTLSRRVGDKIKIASTKQSGVVLVFHYLCMVCAASLCYVVYIPHICYTLYVHINVCVFLNASRVVCFGDCARERVIHLYFMSASRPSFHSFLRISELCFVICIAREWRMYICVCSLEMGWRLICCDLGAQHQQQTPAYIYMYGSFYFTNCSIVLVNV